MIANTSFIDYVNEAESLMRMETYAMLVVERDNLTRMLANPAHAACDMVIARAFLVMVNAEIVKRAMITLP